MHASRKAGGPAPLELRAQRPDGPDVSYVTYPDDEAEAAGVTDAIAALVRGGVAAADIAVLFRTNVQSEAFEAALADRGIALPGARERPVLRPRGRAQGDGAAARRGARARTRARPMPESVRDILRSAGWTDAPPEGRGASRERWDALQALVSLADALAAAPPTGDGPPTVADLVAELDERAAAQHAPTVEGVTLASLHAAKGLEWDAVFLVGLSDGLLPTVQAQTDAAVAEERRLLYVGITRAREHLQLSYSRARHPRAPGEPRACRGSSRTCGPTSARRPGVPRRDLDARQQAVVDGLTAWRDAHAAELRRQPASVLTSATIRAIAERVPAHARGARCGPWRRSDDARGRRRGRPGGGARDRARSPLAEPIGRWQKLVDESLVNSVVPRARPVLG